MHGWSASIRTNWETPGWIERLRPLRRVIGVDVRGHGASDKPHEQSRYGYAAMAHDVLAVMDHLEIERADFVGHSLGAFSGVHLLGHHPDRFGAFVLMGIGDETPESLAVLPVITEALRAPSAEAIENPIGRAYRGFVDGDPRNDREALALAALLNGSDDRPYVESDERLVAAIPGARLSRIPGADHLGPVLDPRFQDAAAVFLAEAAPR
jgi:pimeloyl-ACP methyl ester carboxylesterase